MIKKLAKIVGIVAAVGVVLWVMRDRFISIAAPRRPEAPSFRSVPASEPAPGIQAVDGIGPVFAGRLESAGLDDARKLAKATADVVAEAAGVSVARARSWIEQAQNLQ